MKVKGVTENDDKIKPVHGKTFFDLKIIKVKLVYSANLT